MGTWTSCSCSPARIGPSTDAAEVLDEIAPVGLAHIGFKDVGVDPRRGGRARRRDQGARRDELHGGRQHVDRGLPRRPRSVARDIGIDRLLGGTQVDEVLAILAGSATTYLPFPGKPLGHPTQLGGSAADVEADCGRFRAKGCAGVDLLAYRATEADPLELVRAARRGTDGVVLVAGCVGTPDRVRAVAAAGADAFTVGSAVFDGSFRPTVGSLRSQLRAVLDACK